MDRHFSAISILVQLHCTYYFGTITLYVRFIFVCSHSIIVSYVRFILSCTTLEVRICVHSICIVLIIRHKYSAPTELFPATTSHSALPLKSQRWRSCSGAHGGAPVPAPANVRPFHSCPTNSPSSPSTPFVAYLQQPASQWWRSCSVASVPAGANNRPYHPSTANDPSSPSIRSVRSVPSLQKPCVLIQPL